MADNKRAEIFQQQQRVRRIMAQLHTGCGRLPCDNPECASNPGVLLLRLECGNTVYDVMTAFTALDQKAAAAEALRRVKHTVAMRLCELLPAASPPSTPQVAAPAQAGHLPTPSIFLFSIFLLLRLFSALFTRIPYSLTHTHTHTHTHTPSLVCSNVVGS